MAEVRAVISGGRSCGCRNAVVVKTGTLFWDPRDIKRPRDRGGSQDGMGGDPSVRWKPPARICKPPHYNRLEWTDTGQV